MTAAASPGTFQAFLIGCTLSRGWRGGLPVAFSPLLSDPPVVLAILLLLDQLPPTFLRIVSISGGVFALYLAWGLWRGWRIGENPGSPQSFPNPGGALLWRGALLNLLSPGVYTFWTLVNGPLLLAALRQSWAHGGGFVLGFYGAFFGGMLALVLVFHQARRLGPQVVRTLTMLSLLILLGFAIFLLGRGLVGA
jgi:threonine/homoserine/homoserine lactone efflux protein